MAKLVIIRGPCGAGKSAVARALMERVTRPTAFVERDRYMFMFRGRDGVDATDQVLIEQDILTCLERGFDVIFEGNFKPSTHLVLLDRLLAARPDETYCFYLDVSFDETLRRHTSRTQIISEAEMEVLYPDASPLGHATETIIPETSSLDETVALIQHVARL